MLTAVLIAINIALFVWNLCNYRRTKYRGCIWCMVMNGITIAILLLGIFSQDAALAAQFARVVAGVA